MKYKLTIEPIGLMAGLRMAMHSAVHTSAFYTSILSHLQDPKQSLSASDMALIQELSLLYLEIDSLPGRRGSANCDRAELFVQVELLMVESLCCRGWCRRRRWQLAGKSEESCARYRPNKQSPIKLKCRWTHETVFL